jgi:hypothetical protein
MPSAPKPGLAAIPVVEALPIAAKAVVAPAPKPIAAPLGTLAVTTSAATSSVAT